MEEPEVAQRYFMEQEHACGCWTAFDVLLWKSVVLHCPDHQAMIIFGSLNAIAFMEEVHL